MKAGYSGLNLFHSRTQIGALEAARDDNILLQILTAGFVLRRQLLNLGQRSEGCSVAGAAVEDGIDDRVQRCTGLVAQADANRVGSAICNQRISGGDTVEDGGCVFSHLHGGEAEPGGDGGVYLEVCGGTADGVGNAILYVDDTVDLADGA